MELAFDLPAMALAGVSATQSNFGIWGSIMCALLLLTRAAVAARVETAANETT
jgi:hypothetical protein